MTLYRCEKCHFGYADYCHNCAGEKLYCLECYKEIKRWSCVKKKFCDHSCSNSYYNKILKKKFGGVILPG